MIRQVVVSAIAVILSVNSAYLAQRHGGSFSNALVANLVLWLFLAHWLSGLIGSVASILLKDSAVDEKSLGHEKPKSKRKLHENALSEDNFPSAGASEVTSVTPALSQEPVSTPVSATVSTAPAVVQKPEDRIRLNETLPSVFKFRQPKKSSDRLLAIRG